MNNRTYLFMVALLIFQPNSMRGNEKIPDVEKRDLAKASIMDISDRAVGTHDASNIGLYFTNYGRISRGTFNSRYAGEYPINSYHNYIWKLMPMVGVAPDRASNRAANVIQSIYLTSLEWEAVENFHNPDNATIAFSDDASTWPASVWFFHDEEDNPLLVSNQDSYCAYNDANNSVEVLGIQTIKTGYAFSNPDIKDMIFYKFEITNQSLASYDSVYFGFYWDFDCGDSPGGVDEYSDDKLGFDASNNFLWVYDADNYSSDWGSQPGMVGIALLESPLVDGVMAGITDMHYQKLELEDSTLIANLSSNLEYLPKGASPVNYFNTGNSPDIHFDDPGLIPSGGIDVYGNLASGPFDLSPLDTLQFIIAIIAGNDQDDLFTNLAAAQALYANHFETPKPPPAPTLSGRAGPTKATLYWTNEKEAELDEYTGVQDFEGYRLYKSVDRGLHWDQIDRNSTPDVGNLVVPLASFDRINGWGDDTGLEYVYTDNSVIDGIEYWYSITAFDHDDSFTSSLESPIGNSVNAANVVSIIPRSEPTNYDPASPINLVHYAGGKSNYILDVEPVSTEQLSNYTYNLHFLYAFQYEIGNSGIWASIDIIDSTTVSTTNFGIRFTSETEIDIINIDTQTSLWAGDLYLNYPYPFGTGFTLTFFRTDAINVPSPGDLLSLNFCAELLRYDGQDTVQVIAPQRFDPGRDLVSDDGLILSLNPQATIQNINVPPILDFDIEIEVTDIDSIQDLDYQIVVTGSGVDAENKTFLVLRTTDANATILGVADTIYYGGEIRYGGVTAWFAFNPDNPPPQGTIATFSTLPPIRPKIQDYYSFGIAAAKTSPDRSAEELEKIRVVPNPYVAGSLWESDLGSYTREPVRQLQFTHLPTECEINIFTLSGDLIKTLEHDATHGTETWDLRAEGGREIVSGIYLYQVKSGGHEYLNRFAVIK